MILALYYKFLFILDRNLAKANCTENRVCMSCNTVVLDPNIKRLASSALHCSTAACLDEVLSTVKATFFSCICRRVLY